MSWQPDQYLRFADHRLRPALDLLEHIAVQAPARVIDLGCGAGNVTRLLRERWPDAVLTGVDGSAEMLQRARTAFDGGHWVEARIEEWAPDEPVDVLFSNAALHWVDDHRKLLARLAGWIAPGGVLAVQMPGNFEAPSHRAIRELAAAPEWRERLESARMGAVLDPADYHHLLAAHFPRVDLWEAVYWQRLQGEGSVLEWLRGTTLVPYLQRLDGSEGARFCDALGARLTMAYPVDADGSVLFPFRRLFFVASR